MPVKPFTLRSSSVPIPFNRLPKFRNPSVDLSLQLILSSEILAGDESTLHQKRSFNKVSSVVIHVEDWERFACAPIHVVRPGSMIAGRPLEKPKHFYQTPDALLPADKSALDPDNECHDAEARRARGNDIIIARQVLTNGAGNGMGSFPVIPERSLLKHREEFIIRERAG